MLCPSRSLWRRAWQDRVSQHNIRPARPRPRPRPIFLVSDRSCPKTDGLRPHQRYVCVDLWYVSEVIEWFRRNILCWFPVWLQRSDQLLTEREIWIINSWSGFWMWKGISPDPRINHCECEHCSVIIIIIILTIIIPVTIFIVLSSWPGHCESSLGSFDECRTAPSGRRPSDQATWLGLWVRL